MRSEKAFTLVEVILALGIFAIVAIPIVSMFLDGIRITSKTENTSEAYAYAQQYVEKLKGGEIGVIATEEPLSINGTEYTYSIDVLSTTVDVQADGEDFYKNMNNTEAYSMTLDNQRLGTKTLTSFDNIQINASGYWRLHKGTTYVSQIAVVKDKVWLKYSNLTSPVTLKIDNQSGKELDIYLQWDKNSTSGKKENLKIKTIGGIVNVYGPIEDIPKNRGRKKTSMVTVTVKNERTGEHAELTTNVVYYE